MNPSLTQISVVFTPPKLFIAGDMPGNCAVYGCYNTQKKTAGVRYFRFPKEKEIRQRWIHSCCRSDNVNADNARVCSVHFDDCDYEDDMKSRLLGIATPTKQRTLKNDAIPSLLLPQGTTDEAAGSTERLQRAKNRGIKRTIEDMMSNTGSGISGSSNKCSVIEKDDVQSCDESVSNQPSETDKTISPLSEEQQLKINYLEEENEILKKENQELKSKVNDLLTNRSQMYSYSELENLLTPVFSKTQLDALLNKKKIKRWPDEDVSAAFTLRS
ncbi:hypothetical protein Pcinc_000938 [Petrolisthes cinctipes]|uniref:THAP-type domain-containing protein n=2 Tax=Petrolisthes cinctipes TaxID=88211 RepID=A0AAE1GL43_PETCI|nr:hypothetical protein Pcinc_000938 [Petrolisthes cinctipes]